MTLVLFFLDFVLLPFFLLLLVFFTGSGSREGDGRVRGTGVVDLPLTQCSDEMSLRGDTDLSL